MGSEEGVIILGQVQAKAMSLLVFLFVVEVAGIVWYLSTVSDDMSEAMAELISVASDSESLVPEEDELSALLGALQAEAIPILVRAVPSLEGTDLREPLSQALDRLVSAHPGSVLTLLGAEDPMVVAEASRIVARLRLDGAEDHLAKLLDRPEAMVRLGALEALESRIAALRHERDAAANVAGILQGYPLLEDDDVLPLLAGDLPTVTPSIVNAAMSLRATRLCLMSPTT